VTDPAAATASETAAAGKVLWEFTDPDMGYTYGRPIIAKTPKYGWVVIVSSGYNNTFGGTVANRGKGYLYILNAKTGALLEKIGTGAGDETTPSGFAPINGFIQDFTAWTVDQIYGGDLLGNLWRFDLTQAAGTVSPYPAPEKIASLKDASNNVQPITVAPKIEIDRNRVDRWVFVGTGRLLDSSDISSTAVQSFYALRDGSVTAPYTSGTLPSGVTQPVDRANMVTLSDPTAGITKDATKPMGWFYDMTAHSGGSAERIVNPTTANSGVISWIGQKPASDPCSPGFSSYIYLVDYATGASRLRDASGAIIASYLVPTSYAYALKVIFAKGADGKVRTLFGAGTGRTGRAPGDLSSATGTPARLNWREVLQ
jgi:type IV pilus assembly protein PilY1